MSLSRLEHLFLQRVDQKCTVEEEKELMLLIAQPENEAAIKALIEKVMKNTAFDRALPDQQADVILKNIFDAEKTLVVPIKKRVIFLTAWRVAAAAIIFLILASAYWFVDRKWNSDAAVAHKRPIESLPKGVKAALTTADGRIISLDNTANGKVAEQGNTTIFKMDKTLEYSAKTSLNKKVSEMYNSVSTFGGGQYQVILSDHTKVWLNAKSQLRFPTAFTGSNRIVELTGEAYFEVAKNKGKPFKVYVQGTLVEVLGTHFNISGYSEEADLVTSLLEGSVKVTKGHVQELLQPGQQAILNKKEDEMKIATADIDKVVAWKNGLFQFRNADITAIMREIGRWYDVEILYAGKTPLKRFEGKISRDAPLSDVLQILELSKINFTVEGKRITVH